MENQENQGQETLTLDVTTLPALSAVERDYVKLVLRKSGGNKILAAKTLGVSVKTLYNKLNSYEQSTAATTANE